MATFLLIHGAFRGAWAWERVTPLLEADGHRGIAIDLPLAGERWQDEPPPIGLDDYIDAVLDAAYDLDHPIVVGHSQGGFIAGAAVARDPRAFSGLAYLDAPIPIPGKRALDIRAPAASDFPVPDLDRSDIVQPILAEAGEHMTAEDAAFINARLCPLPAGPSLDPVTAAPPDDLLTAVAFCEHSSPFVPARATRAAMDEAGAPYTLIDGHHDVTITEPGAVARWLGDIVGDQRTTA